MVYLEINAISYGYTPVLLSFDGGYMYGPVSSNNIEEKETEEDNEQETEEDDEQ